MSLRVWVVERENGSSSSTDVVVAPSAERAIELARAERIDDLGAWEADPEGLAWARENEERRWSAQAISLLTEQVVTGWSP
jgi:hypothetical protein